MQVNISGHMRLRFVKLMLKLDGHLTDVGAKHLPNDGQPTQNSKGSKLFRTTMQNAVRAMKEKPEFNDPPTNRLNERRILATPTDVQPMSGDYKTVDNDKVHQGIRELSSQVLRLTKENLVKRKSMNSAQR